MDDLAFLGLTVAFLVGILASGVTSLEAGLCLLLLGVVLPIVLLRLQEKNFKPWVWLLFVLVGVGAYFYANWRAPRPVPNDVASKAPIQRAVLTGKVLDTPRLTRSGKARFTLQAETLTLPQAKQGELVGGKLYTTVSVLQVTGVRPGQVVKIQGNLYKPNAPKNPHQFDFRQFLQRQGIFAGLAGRNLQIVQPPPWGLWQIRDRMTKAHVWGAGMPEGVLLSSLVLGSRAVDLPPQVKDDFVKVGLAHALAASGFHVSIVLAFVLVLCQGLPPLPRFLVGTGGLLGYLALTGISPSILRAVVMGIGLMTGELLDRKSRPLSGLALAAVLLLLYNPLWLWDLGFQFSFLATLGLQTTATSISNRTLQNLPPLLASSIAVPIAAFVWTLPLQLYGIGAFSAYSLLANLLASPLFVVLILGGIVSGIGGVIYVPAGAVLAWFLKPIAILVMQIVTVVGNLPGSFRTTGTIALWQMTLAYGLIILVWLSPWWQRQQQVWEMKFPRWLMAGLLVAAVLFIPQVWQRSRLFQAIVFDSGSAPVMLIQSQGKNILINTGNRSHASLNLVSFMQKQGITRLDWGIATHSTPDVSDGWHVLLDKGVKIEQFASMQDLSMSQTYRQLIADLNRAGITPQSLEPGKVITLDDKVTIEVIQSNPPALVLTIGDNRWLFIGNMTLQQQRQLLEQGEKIRATVLWWSGGELLPELVKQAGITTLVASTNRLLPPTTAKLEELNITTFTTGREGAIGWSDDSEVNPLSELDERGTAL
ncbi:MAG: ComEC/Rec2 family competence protein [Pseudanabaenaceae cyanobacterium SKYGB_i_bin29]|nr:ComEC/Rec2 family competence protein [Pseudanabaenaceae cyanobacterium SKYG29]MDW8420367.1 ComEC/Rec2 family competence protein [Pseudanabaenaceae cyanobacterium SKYGB_i_bin29]